MRNSMGYFLYTQAKLVLGFCFFRTHLNPLLKREDFMTKSQNQFVTSIKEKQGQLDE
jgi:hypothetical protein